MRRVTDGEGQAAPPAGPPSRGGGENGTHDRAETPAAAARLRYLPGLDGLRALAVLAVLVYHADVAWLPGGFLGVDVFFVISGYLITSLLLAERSATGRIKLRRFWARRARRLLPALFALLAVVAVVVLAWVPDQQARLGGDVGAAFTYSTNWYLIFHQESYFVALGRPSLLRHLWSLAVEEQFYLAWPLIFAAGLALYGKRWFPKVILVGALVSAVLMALLFIPGTDPSRVYFGTDTRAAGLLVGSLLAFAWVPGRLSTRPRLAGRALLTLGAARLISSSGALHHVRLGVRHLPLPGRLPAWWRCSPPCWWPRRRIPVAPRRRCWDGRPSCGSGCGRTPSISGTGRFSC